MSSILEALKKLEEEKAARRGGMGNLAGKVARTGRRTPRNSLALVVGGMLAVAVVSALATYLAMNGLPGSRGDKTLQNGPAPSSLPPVSQELPNAAPTSAGQPGAVSIVSPKVAPDHPVAPVPIAGKTAPRPSAGRATPPPPPGNPSAERTAPVKALPTLTVSGIAWQKDNVNRMAVVNSTPVREEGIIDGAVVKEILPDRVRFSYNGKEFDVSLEK